MVHGQIWRIPVSKHTEPFELLTLDIDIPFRIFPAELPDFKLAHPPLLRPQGLVHLMLDREAVTVPSGHIGGIKALHGF